MVAENIWTWLGKPSSIAVIPVFKKSRRNEDWNQTLVVRTSSIAMNQVGRQLENSRSRRLGKIMEKVTLTELKIVLS